MHRSAALAALVCAVSTTRLRVHVDHRSGAFEVLVGEAPWLTGTEYGVGDLRATSGGLVLLGASEADGSDGLGEFSATTLRWARRDSEDVLMETTFREYSHQSGLVVFEQYFPATVDFKGLPQGRGGSVFPAFSRGGKNEADLPCFAYHGTFAVLRSCTLSTYSPSRQGGVPLVIYNASDPSLPMVVFSPLSSPMASQTVAGSDFFGAGVKQNATLIPAGWRQLFVLSAGKGINDGMMLWGDRMLRFAGRPRVDNMYRDDVHGALGFWTDNGGYYHYSLGNDSSLGATYEDVLPKVLRYHESIGVPFRHWQFDSWFYPKDGRPSPGGGGPGVTNWTALGSVFPRGMARIQEKLRKPMVMHNRQWAVQNDYMRSWSDLAWYASGTAALPADPVRFFERFFAQQEGWGLAMYEQDWMTAQYVKTPELDANISLGDLWLKGMADGASGSNRTIQYCMALPNQVLSGAAHPALTNVRASMDYSVKADQWAIGGTALFLWALGLLPFKDGFYSSSLVQVGGQNPGPELHPDRQALMAVLSGAMVAAMDGFQLVNSTRLKATCRADGMILKPDRPLTTTDACFRRRHPGCKVYVTHSDVAGLPRAYYYFNDAGTAPVLADEVYLSGTDLRDHVLFNWYTRDLARLSTTNVLRPGYEGHIYAIILPILQGWILLGEIDKYVPLSKLRFERVREEDGRLLARVRGSAGEVTRVCAARADELRVICAEVRFAKDSLVQRVVFPTEEAVLI